MIYGLEIDRNSNRSITSQLTMQLRDAVLNGNMSSGTKLPPTRMLAQELGVARNTIIQVYEQLVAEGYLVSTGGSGTYVANIGKLPREEKKQIEKKMQKSRYPGDVISFNAGNPDLSAFPRSQWAKLLKEACLDTEVNSYRYGDFSGEAILQKALASYLYRMKGIQCNQDQIIIVPGASGGLDLIAQTFKHQEASVIIEDPCINFVKFIFEKYDYRIHPIDVDHQGMKADQLNQITKAELIYVVPSHQFPLGGILPVARRIELLQYACDQDAYIIEDDYDSEFRYQGEVIQPLRNLQPDRVIYLGSFSKIFSPSLRMGYLIVPEQLKERIIGQMEMSNLRVNTVEQRAMAQYINSMLLDRHIYKMKKLYEGKRKHLIMCLKQNFGVKITISGENAGLHLLVSFDRDLTESHFEKLLEEGVEVDWVEEYSYRKGKHRGQMVLGYGELSRQEIEEGIRRIACLLKEA